MKEIFKKINNFDYEISNLGNVRSLNKYNKKFRPKYYNKNMTPIKGNDGYLRIKLSSNNNTKTFLIHRLVALYFVDGFIEGKEANHKDGNKNNNSFNNLKWDFPSDNMIHSVINNLKPITCKLNEWDVRFIKLWLKCGFKHKDIAAAFKVTRSTITDINCGKTWSYVSLF